MKTFNSLRVMAVAAMMTVATVAASAAPKAKVFVNSYFKQNYAVVSAVPAEGDIIKSLEVTDETGNVIYVSKRLANVKSAQYLLNIAKLQDGVYTVNFKFGDNTEISKTFVVADNTVVK